jgi:hypothetical protein
MIENSLIPSQGVNVTDAPQPTATNVGASDASPFQQAANSDVLKQNTAIQVISNGNPLTGSDGTSSNSSSPILFLLISMAVLVIALIYLVLRATKRPVIAEIEIEEDSKEAVLKKPAKSKVIPNSKPKSKPKNKKKSSRTKRSK